jgi:dCMP deaminase
MSRISREQMFMAIARVASLRSTCHRLNVGAVVVGDRSVLAIGYNGAGTGDPHCTGNDCRYYTERGCSVLHAEENALRRCAGGDEIYVTHSPCGYCAAKIVERRIKRVYFEAPYRDTEPLNHLIRHGIGVYRLLPSGYIIDCVTNAVAVP